MTFSESYSYALNVIAGYGLTNKIISVTDNAVENIGHTIPFVYEDMTPVERSILKSGDKGWTDISNMISKKRIFLNGMEKTTYKKSMAVTIEPRLTVLKNSTFPMSSFHTTLLIDEKGNKELLTDFNEIFTLLHMNYMIE